MWSAFRVILPNPFLLRIPHHVHVQLSLLKTDSRHKRYSNEVLILWFIWVIPPFHKWLFSLIFLWDLLIFSLTSIGIAFPKCDSTSFLLVSSLGFIPILDLLIAIPLCFTQYLASGLDNLYLQTKHKPYQYFLWFMTTKPLKSTRLAEGAHQ